MLKKKDFQYGEVSTTAKIFSISKFLAQKNHPKQFAPEQKIHMTWIGVSSGLFCEI